MKIQFSLALISAAASAACSEQTKANFLGSAAAFNWHIDDVHDMEFRIGVYQDNQKTVDHLNETNIGVSFAMNATSNLTDDEFSKMQGAHPGHDENDNGRKLYHEDGEGRRLNNDKSINWVSKGKMTPVKNQGGCGSCWAFAATTAMEGMQAITNGGTPLRLSEQEGVDCVSRSYGCGGGWMNHYWDWSRDNGGSQTNTDYPYEASTRACRNQSGKVSVSQAKSHGYARSIDEMKTKLQSGPMTIAVAAGNSCWRYYSAGVLSKANNCPTSIDHGVVVVGLHMPGDDGDGGDGGDNDDDDDEQEFKRKCRRATRVERRDKECEGEDESLEPNRKGKPNRKCCRYIPIQSESVQNDPDADKTYWIVQNSWGKNWGIDGFVRLAVEEGAGVSGMNQYVEYMTVKEGDPSPTPDPQPQDRDCSIDEAKNELGPNRCQYAHECSGDRTCSQWGWCAGKSNCP